MRIIIGLGNPEEKYENTRHNVGFMVLEALGEALGNLVFENRKKFQAEMTEGREFVLVKPQTYMNNSGRSVAALAGFFKVEKNQIVVVHDDLDLPLGEYKIQMGKGPKVHNGILSCEESLGSKDFWRVRVGIDARINRAQVSGEDYVLGKFSGLELEKLKETIKMVVLELQRMVE